MSPWALGVGVLVSFTAAAGQDPASDLNVSPIAARSRLTTYETASFGDAATGDFGAYGQTRALVQKAHLAVGEPEDMRSIPDEREPHIDLKPEVKIFPEVDRTHKGDPVVSMRPTMETRAAPSRGIGLIKPKYAANGDNSFAIASRSREELRPRLTKPPVAVAVQEETAANDAAATTQKSSPTASPTQIASISTSPAPEAPRENPAQTKASETPSATMQDRVAHGATPSVSRAVALGSSTPAQPDSTPVAVSFVGPTFALGAPGKKDESRPDYASLLNADKLDREKRCLAEAVYFESRSEPETGQAAVAQVVLNRVSSGLYPSSICGVVYQNRHHYHGCQFSFACEGRSLRVTERDSWEQAVRVANEVMDGRTYISDVGQSTHYHANYVRPRWARALTKMDVIGRHIFYRLKPGQT